MAKPNKTLQVSGHADVRAEAGHLGIVAKGGLVSVTVFDTAGLVVYIYHPLSGWYAEHDMRSGGLDDGEENDS